MPIVLFSYLSSKSISKLILLGSIEIVYKRNNEMDKFKENDAGIKKIASNNISLSFEKVSYSYASSNTFALKNISLAIPANKITANGAFDAKHFSISLTRYSNVSVMALSRLMLLRSKSFNS